MEPKSSEQMPTPIEYTPQVPQSSGEQPLDRPVVQPEQQEVSIEKAGEQLRQVTQASTIQAQQPSTAQLPTPVQAAQGDDTALTDDIPAVASDDDLIEKEWVDKAKKIIAETKEDPHKRERAVNKLQIEYLKKRYGKELGSDAT